MSLDASASPYLFNGNSSNNSCNTDKPIWLVLQRDAWLAVPIVAAVGWIQTWIIAAILAGSDYAFAADRRYAGIAKRTFLPLSLALRPYTFRTTTTISSSTPEPRRIIGCATMDPGISTRLKSLQSDEKCHAGAFTVVIWLVQALATLYAIVSASIVWAAAAQDTALFSSNHAIAALLFSQLLAALNVNRGTWALAVIGCLMPLSSWRIVGLSVTTGIAVALDILFIIRAFLVAAQIASLPYVPLWVYIIAYLFPSLEGFVFIMGVIAVIFRVAYLGPLVFLPGALWLAFGPFVIIAFSVALHFAETSVA